MKPGISGNLFYANMMIALIAVCALASDLKSEPEQGPVFAEVVTTLLHR